MPCGPLSLPAACHVAPLPRGSSPCHPCHRPHTGAPPTFTLAVCMLAGASSKLQGGSARSASAAETPQTLPGSHSGSESQIAAGRFLRLGTSVLCAGCLLAVLAARGAMLLVCVETKSRGPCRVRAVWTQPVWRRGTFCYIVILSAVGATHETILKLPLINDN